ncbi:uncharacterized protein [Phaseolus vulgaris]|uniref:uncharacterized protein n=1 Tax=Phaseolus vulgaris TaxID=3885 RepID=UPI0035CC844E
MVDIQQATVVPRPFETYTGCLYGIADNQVEVRGYLELRTTFTDGAASRTESIRYLVVNANSAYNILLGRPTLNRLRAVSSTRHMKMKLSDLSGRNKAKTSIAASSKAEASSSFKGFGFFKTLNTTWFNSVFMVFERPSSSDTAIEVEPSNEATPTESTLGEAAAVGATPKADARTEERHDDASPVEEASPREHYEATPPKEDSRDQPAANVVERQIGGKTFKLGRLLSQEEQDEVAEVISRHLDAFVWSASDMSGIDPDFLCHHLSMDATIRPVRQSRRKFNEERRLVVKEETQKLLSVGHIREIQYPKWLANVVLVKKANGKWRMCVDFTDLNKACPKDSYPLPSIDALVDSASGCEMLSFLDAFSGYNQIKMHPRDEGRNVQAYVDDMVVASRDRRQHTTDLEELFTTISKYRLKLNPEKCVFGVEAGKFLGFMLTERGN